MMFSPETARAEIARLSARIAVLEDGFARLRAIVDVAGVMGEAMTIAALAALAHDLDVSRRATPI